MTLHRPFAAMLAWAWMLTTITGCAGGGSFLNENDRLRAENQKLRERVEKLKKDKTGLERQLRIEQSRRAMKLPEGVVQPTAVRIGIGRYSGGVDLDRDGRDEAVRIYLKVLDAQDRFVLTAGRLEMSVVQITPGAEAKTVGTCSLDAKAFDKTYRSGLTGTHHTVVCKVDRSLVPEGTKQLTVRAAFTDLTTGNVFEHERTVRWKP